MEDDAPQQKPAQGIGAGNGLDSGAEFARRFEIVTGAELQPFDYVLESLARLLLDVAEKRISGELPEPLALPE